MKFHQNNYLRFLIAPILAIVAFILFVGYGIYRYHWQGDFVFKLARFIPYPALLVDWEAVSYHTYLDSLRTLKRYWQTQRKNSNVILGIPDEEEIREKLVENLVEQKLVQMWARQNGVRVSPEEVDKEWELQAPDQAGSKDEVASFLEAAYGWKEEQFKKNILYQFLLTEKVKVALRSVQKLDDQELLRRAGKIFTLTQAKEADFTQLAGEYSDDRQSARRGGDLGYFPRGAFEPQVEEAIFSLKVGQISQPVKSSFGYHIILLDDLLYNDKGVATQAAVKQILVKSFDFDEWLEKQKSAVSIYRLVL